MKTMFWNLSKELRKMDLKYSQKAENFVEWIAVNSRKRKQNDHALFPKKIKGDDEQF